MKAQGKIEISQPAPERLQAVLSGDWQIGARLPSPATVLDRLTSDSGIKGLVIDCHDLQEWDSTFLVFIRTIRTECQKKNIDIEMRELPEGASRLLHLASVMSRRQDEVGRKKHTSFLYVVGASAVHFVRSTIEMLDFIGEATLSLGRFLTGRARFRRIDLLTFIEDCGIRSLPIITLISVVVGLILAFVGAVQLRMFGAQIYVADLVAIAMAREMGALMTGVIMSGRIGAAYAAQLGTMQVNEEIDALVTMGIEPMEFLVLPRLFAMVLMMPLLTLYADLLGILGGGIVGVSMMDMSFAQYFSETQAVLDLTNLWLGISKAGIYSIIIALAGCMRGMQSGRSAAAVGDAATTAVVTAIVGIVVTDGIFAVLCDVLGI
jgi:phospholipid/cholesterol/gamma-HCH transport system permease protein